MAVVCLSLGSCGEEEAKGKYDFVDTCLECTTLDCCSCECKVGQEQTAEYYLCAGIQACKAACIDLCAE